MFDSCASDFHAIHSNPPPFPSTRVSPHHLGRLRLHRGTTQASETKRSFRPLLPLKPCAVMRWSSAGVVLGGALSVPRDRSGVLCGRRVLSQASLRLQKPLCSYSESPGIEKRMNMDGSSFTSDKYGFEPIPGGSAHPRLMKCQECKVCCKEPT